MLHIALNDASSLLNMLEILKNSLGGELENLDREHNFITDNSKSKGAIRSSIFNDGLGFVDFDIVFNDDVVIETNTKEVNKLYFIYCLEGRFDLQLHEDGQWVHLETYQSVVVSTSHLDRVAAKFQKADQIVLNIIMFDREVFIHNRGYLSDNTDPLNILFSQVDGDAMIFFGNYDYRIAQQVRMLKDIEQDGVLRNMIIENQVNVILASQLQYYLLDRNADGQASGLTKHEIKKAMEMADHIRQHPSKPHSIKSLSALDGLSSAKMQAAFKHLYDHTVSDFVKEVRLEKAEELINTTDLSISEVVYAVGFNSRSYFSKIFKEKYKHSPKKYKSRN